MRKLAMSLTLALSVGFSSLAGGTVFAESAVVSATDTSLQKNQLKAFEDLKAMFAAEQVDVAKAKAQYIEKLQADVKAANPDIDAKIIFALDAAIAGSLSAAQVKQAVDKGLQWYFYTAITNLTKTDAANALNEGNVTVAKQALDKAIELYMGSLNSTAGKRDTGFAKYGVRTQDLLLTIVIPGLQKAVDEKNVLNYNLYRQMLDKTLIKVFHLGTMGYAEKVPTQTNAAEAKISIMEGYFFYMPIVNSLKGGNLESAETIEKAFASGNPANIDPQKIKAAFIGAFNGKISGYVNKTIASMEKNDLSVAQITAMEGNMFLAAEEVLIKEMLGAAAYEAATASAQKYFEAVKSGNLAEARVQSFDVLKLIAKLDGVHLKLNSDIVTVHGKQMKVDAKVYVNPKIRRTLVPAKVIAESLGAVVSYKAETRTIVIQKGSTTIELVVGSRSVIQNGQVNDKLTLEQPVEIKNKRSFIPLRAVAELFGSKVFYSNQEIVVVK